MHTGFHPLKYFKSSAPERERRLVVPVSCGAASSSALEMRPGAFEFGVCAERKSKGISIPDFIEVDTAAGSDRRGTVRRKGLTVSVSNKENSDPNQFQISLNRRKPRKERAVTRPTAESTTKTQQIARPNSLLSPTSRLTINASSGLKQKHRSGEKARQDPSPPLAEAMGRHASYIERCRANASRRGRSKLAPCDAPIAARAVFVNGD